MPDEGVQIHFFSCSQPIDQWPTVTVCIKRVGPGQHHIGIGYRNGVDSRLLHLAWHLKLTDSKLCEDNRYRGIAVNAPVIRQEEVALFCERVYNANGRSIPYAFGAPNGCIDEETGKALFGPTSLGLTCATFVLAVFEAVGISLLKYDDWPATRDGDEHSRETIVDALSQERANDEHVKAIKIASPGIRYRPEDVGAGAACFPPPATYSQTRAYAAEIISKLP